MDIIILNIVDIFIIIMNKPPLSSTGMTGCSVLRCRLGREIQVCFLCFIISITREGFVTVTFIDN